jgi:integrase
VPIPFWKAGEIRVSLNAIKVENLKPRKTDYRVADGSGLYVLVRPTGSKLWRYDYRLGDARRTLSIGEYNAQGDGKTSFTLKQARDEHEEARAAVKAGQHPVSPAQRAAKAKAEADAEARARLEEAGDRSFGALADIWLEARKSNLSPKSHARDKRSVTHLKDGYRTGRGFGSVDVEQVNSSHLSSLLEVFNKPTRIRVLSAARKIMAVAKRKNLINVSPFADIDFSEGFEKHRTKKRPAIIDEKQFGNLMRKIENYDGRSNNLTWYGLKLLALTFVRPDTMAKAEWQHFDLGRSRWVIPFEKLKMEWLRTENGQRPEDFVVPLSRQAVALLRELHGITGKSRYLFPGCGDAEVMSENTLNYALHSLGYKGLHCAHGFRASASTILNRQRTSKGRRRFETALVEIQQDRLDASTRAIYDRDDLMPERDELMQFWADKIDELRDGKTPTRHLRAVG